MYHLILPRLSSPEAPEEPPSVVEENVSKVECNISGNTNFMISGIMEVRYLLTVSTQALIVDVGTQPNSCQGFPDPWARSDVQLMLTPISTPVISYDPYGSIHLAS